MRRGTTVAVVAGTIAMLAGGAAVAAELESDQDARGDTFGHPVGDPADYDIASSRYGRVGEHKLRHTVTVMGRAGDPKRKAALAVPLVLIDVPKVSGQTEYCDFYVGRNSKGEGPGVYECGDETKRGSASIVRTSRGTLRYEFNRKTIRNPDSYGWAIAVRGRAGGSTVTHDRMPDFGFDKYRIR